MESLYPPSRYLDASSTLQPRRGLDVGSTLGSMRPRRLDARALIVQTLDTALSDPRFTAKASSCGFEVPSGRPSGLYASEISHSESTANPALGLSPAQNSTAQRHGVYPILRRYMLYLVAKGFLYRQQVLCYPIMEGDFRIPMTIVQTGSPNGCGWVGIRA